MALRAYRLKEFLGPKTAAVSGLPLVHTTPAKNVFDVLNQSKLLATPCNVFHGEKLCYLFVGRPAYKWSIPGDASDWQLPLVFVMEASSKLPIKRIHPFDTGAFNQRLPEYLTTFPMENFELGTDPAIVGKFVELFYGSPDRYMKGQAIGENELVTAHQLGPRHHEVQAVARLSNDRSNAGFDDRARAVELQVTSDIKLNDGNLLGVVGPRGYLIDPEIRAALDALGGQVELYDEYPLQIHAYFSGIYDAVKRIYKKALE